MRRLALFLPFVLLLGLTAPGTVQAQEPVSDTTAYVPVTEFDPARDAAADVQAAVAEARRTGKRILLDVGGEWCGWCHRMDRFIEETPAVEAALHDNYVVVKVNYSPENKNEVLLSQYPAIPGYPHLFVLDQDGTLLHSQGTAELEEDDGYSEEAFLAFLQEWAPSS